MKSFLNSILLFIISITLGVILIPSSIILTIPIVFVVDYFIFNSTGSAISISFTLKDLTGATLTTIPANTSYHIFYNGTNYIKI